MLINFIESFFIFGAEILFNTLVKRIKLRRERRSSPERHRIIINNSQQVNIFISDIKESDKDYRFYSIIKKYNAKLLDLFDLSSVELTDQNLDEFGDIGYIKETIVTSTGEMAVRGFVLDVFP